MLPVWALPGAACAIAAGADVATWATAGVFPCDANVGRPMASPDNTTSESTSSAPMDSLFLFIFPSLLFLPYLVFLYPRVHLFPMIPPSCGDLVDFVWRLDVVCVHIAKLCPGDPVRRCWPVCARRGVALPSTTAKIRNSVRNRTEPPATGCCLRFVYRPNKGRPTSLRPSWANIRPPCWPNWATTQRRFKACKMSVVSPARVMT
jgi:hypothetical protein